ncbi:MAG: phosphatidylserine decarboxylase [Candidatus Lambdaproteobacteria bacterium]|nr:phosphatidylserine decarboxylase [Candidatus Lambdaproteobacteria bacterium]
MYYRLFRWFPKSAFSRLMGVLAGIAWPGPVLRVVIALYVRAYRIDMSVFVEPAGGFRTFNAFFTRGLRPGARPMDAAAQAIVSPVDGTVIEAGRIEAGRLLQAKGRDFSLRELLGDDPAWAAFDGGAFLSLYLSPRDYHRIHTPCAGRVTRFRHVPGELWTVSPAGVQGVPDLFARNERLITFMDTALGELAVIKVGATVVGKIRVVYHEVTSNRPGAGLLACTLPQPVALDKGAELGRFELGSTVILLLPPGAARLEPLRSGDPVRMGQTVAKAGA